MSNDVKHPAQHDPRELPPTGGKGWRTTISHPAKIPGHECKPLASGVDGIVLAADILWNDGEFFSRLNELKEQAASKEQPVPLEIKSPDGSQLLICEVQPFGKEGYQWMLGSPEYHIKLGNWLMPKTRPSAMIQISSVTLWIHGLAEAIDRLVQLFEGVGGRFANIKASRIDVCVDVQVPNDLWGLKLAEHAVTRASDMSFHFKHRELTGIQIGKGVVLARVYDKALEIQTKSHKTWMYDIWNIEKVPNGQRVVRFEFQLRREALKDLAIDTIWDFINHPRNLWAYCTQDWLKFTDNPNLLTRRQKVLPFWSTVQEGFLGGQLGHPLARAKAINVQRKKLAQQLMGQFTSLIALGTTERVPSVRLEEQLPLVTESAELLGLDDDRLSDRVRMKKGRYLRATEKFEEAEAMRKAQGLPTVSRKEAV